MVATRALLSIISVFVAVAIVISIVLVSPQSQKALDVGSDTSLSSSYLFDTPLISGLGNELVVDHYYNYSLAAKAGSHVREMLLSDNTTHWWYVFVIYCEQGVSPSDVKITTSVQKGDSLMNGEVRWVAVDEKTIIGLGNAVPVSMIYHAGQHTPDPNEINLDATMNGTLVFHEKGDYSINITVASVEGTSISPVSPSKLLGKIAPPSISSIQNVTSPILKPSMPDGNASIGTNKEPALPDPYENNAASITPTVPASNLFANLRVDGYWPLESSGQKVSISSNGQMVGQPVAGLNYEESSKTTAITVGQAYYVWADADAQQAYVDWLKSNGFNHANVWGRVGPNQNIPVAEWRLIISSPGITTGDVIMNSGWGWPSQSNAMAWRPFTQGVDSVGAKLESVPSYYSTSAGNWAVGQWTDEDLVAANFPARTPAAIQFQKAGSYILTFYLVDSSSGNAVSPSVSTTINVGASTTPAEKPCDQPWPSTVQIISRPESMIPGQTYEFKARMIVQNYDATCNATPWYYAPNTNIDWTMTGASGQSSLTDGNGVSTVSFVCPSGGDGVVTASWAGNERYKAANDSVIVPVVASTMSTLSASSGTMVINEYEANPAGDDAGNEWVELFNSGGSAINLTGWTLTTTNNNSVAYALSGTISPGQYAVARFPQQFVDDGGDSIILKDAQGNQLDATPTQSDTQDNSLAWQRVPDAGSSWLLKEGTMGTSNGS